VYDGVHTGFDEEDPLFKVRMKLSELRTDLIGFHKRVDEISNLLRGVESEKGNNRKSDEEIK
jgi:hypothetical protein